MFSFFVFSFLFYSFLSMFIFSTQLWTTCFFCCKKPPFEGIFCILSISWGWWGGSYRWIGVWIGTSPPDIECFSSRTWQNERWGSNSGAERENESE
jgi:hypothetical protein